MGAWLALAAGENRQHGGNDGYEDEPAVTYRWDDTVPNHAAVSVGDHLAIWSKETLLGASVIDHIEVGTSEKITRRCSNCGGAHIKRRRTLEPPWRCFGCSSNFANPRVDVREVRTYASRHESAWVDLQGLLRPAQLRQLCVSPRSQLSIRPLRWDDFVTAVQGAGTDASLGFLDEAASRGPEGHSKGRVRLRIGQGAYRRRLLARYGSVCAITGPAPTDALEAAHLYSYAALGQHHDDGGLLLRRDVHRLFDTGRIAVDPTNLLVDIDERLEAYPAYAALRGRGLAVPVTAAQRGWLALHWSQHRDVAAVSL